MGRPLTVTLAVLLAVLLVGCSGGVTPTTPPTTPATIDISGRWQLQRGTVRDLSIRVLDKHPITLEIDGSRVRGIAACNQYGGRIEVIGARIRFGELEQTAMGCEEPVMTAEKLYTTALGLVEKVARDGEALVLSGPEAELRFAPLASAPASSST